MTQTEVVLPTSLEGKTILVSGAAGFVPGHLSEFYLNLGAKVIGLDNFITGTESTVEILAKYPKFEFYKCNVYESLPDLTNEKIDFVFSMASPASPIDFTKIPIEIMRVNSEGTLALLELSKEKGARFLEASTSEVYGDPEEHPQRETYQGHVNPIGVRSPYDESKRFAESMTMSFNRKYGVDTRIVRIFNTYGPRMRPNDGRVVPNFINHALKNEELEVYGDGTQTRSFCYVSDLIDGIHRVMFSSDPTPFNVGNANEFTIKSFAQRVIELLQSSSQLKYIPLPQEDDPKKTPTCIG